MATQKYFHVSLDARAARRGFSKVFARQPWIRNGWWDGFWILSGVPLGLIFLACMKSGIPAHVIVLSLILLTQT